MARIRTIKPEFCTSEQVAECSTTARLLFVTMWCFCDDGGNHPASVRRLKMECFPGDAFTDEQMVALVGELIGAGLLVPYCVDGKEFWHVSGWKHQRIDKPSYKYPAFSKEHIAPKFDDHSESGARPLCDCPPAEGNGREGSLLEGKGMEGSGVDDKSPTPTKKTKSNVQRNPPSVEAVFGYMADQGFDDAAGEAQAFVDFYAANGWVQGRGKPIKDWQAAVRNWKRNSFRGSAGAKSPVTFTQQREANMQAAGDRFVLGATE